MATKTYQRRKLKPLSESEIKSRIDMEIKDALGWLGSKISNQRREALHHFYREPYGDEKPGRSRIVLGDVSETILWILPKLCRVFSQDQIVRFRARIQEKEEIADQATDYCNYIILSDNPGFMLMYAAFFDALLERFGVWKAYWTTDKSEPE